MKKRWLSLIMLLSLSLSFISGCKNEEQSNLNKLNLNGSDIVLKIGEKTYSADELFADMLNTKIGAESAYSKILRAVIENSVDIDPNITASWELLVDAFEENVKTTAASSGISESEARKQLLAEEGYSSMEEKKSEYFYSVKLDIAQDAYWDLVKEQYWEVKDNDDFVSYFETNLPYYVKHVLVKTAYTSARGPYATNLSSSDDATALYKVYEMLAQDYKFSYIMNQLSEDTGSSSTGTGYYMDLTTSFVTEFLHGVFVFDAMLKGETDEVIGLDQRFLNYYGVTEANDQDYDFGVIYASDIETLGKGNNATDSASEGITVYENVKGENGEITEKSTGSTIGNNYGSYSMYNRSIIFNQTFNNPGISVIAYDLDEENTPKNVKEITINGKKLNVLTDEEGNYVFVVCARGDSTDLWIHFLTVNVSPFDTFENTNGKKDARLFFSVDQTTLIDEMVAEKEAALKEEGKTTEQIKDIIKTYRDKLENYKTYVDIKGGEKVVNRNKIIDELEGYVKTYAKRGITSGAISGEEQFLTYDMVEHYMKSGEITIKSTVVKELVEKYIKNQKALIDLKTINSIQSGWDGYYELISLANSDEITSKKIPMECSHVVNGYSDKTLCKYNYETGFEILVNYLNVEASQIDAKYKSYHIGQQNFVLPTEGLTKEGHTFGGWYYTSDCKEGTEVESIDTTRTSSKNKTQLYAKWIPNTPEA